MTERVSATITIGGRLTTSEFAELTHLILNEDLSLEWDGILFSTNDRPVDQALKLYAHEVAYGRFNALEAWCIEKGLPFARWCGAYPGQWGAQRTVFSGDGVVTTYPVDEEDYPIISRDTVQALGTMEAIEAYFSAADAPISALIIEGDPEFGPD